MKTALHETAMDQQFALDLGCETETVLELAEQGGALPSDHRLMARPEGRDSLLKTRLTRARRSGGFIDPSARRPVSLSAVLAAQRRVAALHGLRYVSARQQSRWVPAGDERGPSGGGRSRNYLSVLLNDPARGFPRLDWALIGHAFGVPAATWEADDDVYEAWVARGADGVRLFRRGLAFFDQLASQGGLMRVRPRDPKSSLTIVAGTRQIGAGGEPGMQHVARGDRVALQLNFPPGFEPGRNAQALVFESDAGGNVSLVSRASLIGDDPGCRDGSEVPPKSASPRPYLFFDTPGVSTIYAVICSDGGLDRLGFYRRTRGETLGDAAIQPLMTPADLMELRHCVLGCHPSGCAIVRTRLEVTA